MLMTNVQHLLFSGKSRLAPWSRLGGRPSRGECWLGWEWEWERGIEGKTCEGVGMGMRTGNRGGGDVRGNGNGNRGERMQGNGNGK